MREDRAVGSSMDHGERYGEGQGGWAPGCADKAGGVSENDSEHGSASAPAHYPALHCCATTTKLPPRTCCCPCAALIPLLSPAPSLSSHPHR